MGTGLDARRIGSEELSHARALLARSPRDNLLLIDLVARLGQAPPPGEMATELVGAFRGPELVGVASLRPTVALDVRIEPDAVDALLPLARTLRVGLLKGEPTRVARLWSRLSRGRRHRVWVDRFETSFAVEPDAARLVDAGSSHRVRRADEADLDTLVHAARESLREEDRPDPFAGDERSFRRWVRGRIERALVVEGEGQVRYVGYADVRRGDGWLLQGIYTWPEARRRGLAAAGTSALCREAFEAGADHVQLAVVDGNEAARQLYEGLGFKPFGRLRTILFT